MFEKVILLAFSSLLALAGLAVVVWEAASRRLFSIDSLTLTFISLTLAAIFGGNVAWSVHNGEVQQLLKHFRKRPAASEAKEKNSLASS